MCIIIDACCRDEVFSITPTPAGAEVVKRIETGQLALVLGGQLTQELVGPSVGSDEARRRVKAWRQAGKAWEVDGAKLADELAWVSTQTLQSNDQHIIALARASGARTLFTRDGKAGGLLTKDFKNKNLVDRPKGAVYRSAEHTKLLKHTGSCGKLNKKRAK